MAGGTSLGEGIGLQSGNRSDYWMRRLADDQRIEDANRRKEEEKIDNLLDFKIDYSKYYPKYGRAIASEYKKVIDNVTKMRQSGNHVPSGAIQAEILKAKEKIGTYEMSNMAAKDYVMKQGIKKDENFIADLISTEGTVSDLQKHNDGSFIRVGPLGEFSYQAVPDKPKPTKYDLNTDFIETQGNKTRVVGNQRIYTVDRKTNPVAIQREAAQLWNDPEFIQQTLFDVRKELPNLNDEQRVALIQQRAIERATQEAPTGFTKEERETIPQAPASSENKKFSAPLQYNTTSTMLRTVVPAKKIIKKGKDGIETTTEVDAKTEEFQMKEPISKAVRTKASIAIQNNPLVIDARTNQPLKGATTLDIRPSVIKVIAVKDDPKDKNSKVTWKKYVLGTIIRNVSGEDEATLSDEGTGKKLETEKTYNVLVPYEGALKSAIEEENVVDDFESAYQELINKGSKKTTTSTVSQSTLNFFK